MVKFQEITLESAVDTYRHNVHSSHILLWTKDDTKEQEVIYGLMQMRSDGRFGFPGGKSDEESVDQKEIVTALYRELDEEINFNPIRGQITLSDRVSTHINLKNGKILHFFAKELSLHSFKVLEKTHMNARDFPEESVGLIRIPLKASGRTTYKPVRKFFANFGRQHFAGNARNQLIESVLSLDLMGEGDHKLFVTAMGHH